MNFVKCELVILCCLKNTFHLVKLNEVYKGAKFQESCGCHAFFGNLVVMLAFMETSSYICYVF